MSYSDQFWFWINIIATVVLLWRLLHIASTFKFKDFSDHKIKYVGLVSGFSIMAAGSIASIGNWDQSDTVLTIGIAIFLVSSRRYRG